MGRLAPTSGLVSTEEPTYVVRAVPGGRGDGRGTGHPIRIVAVGSPGGGDDRRSRVHRRWRILATHERRFRRAVSRGFGAGISGLVPGTRLARGSGHDRRAVRSRRSDRHRDAPRRRADERGSRSAGRRPERGRSGRDPRGRTGRHSRARRLHRPHAPHRDVDGSVPVPRPPVRPARRFQDDRPRDRGADDHHRPEGSSNRRHSRSWSIT